MLVVNCVVCYDNEEEIFEYIKKLERMENNRNIRLVITVNKSDWDKKEFLRRLQKIGIKSHVYYPEDNLGYLNGMIYGYTKYRLEEQEDIKWIVFSNTDIRYTHSDFFSLLVNNEYDNDVWMMGPTVVDDRGYYSNPMRLNRYSRGDLIIRKLCYQFSLLNVVLNAFHYFRKSKDNVKVESRNCYMIHGCYMILKPELVDVLVEQDKWELMYAEENYLAETVRLRGKKVFYDSDLEIVHEAGSVTKALNSRVKRKMNANSLRRIIKEYYE